jgi:hypothetical protein
MPITTIYGDGTRVIGDSTTIPQTLHPNVMAYVNAQSNNGYTPAKSRVDALNNLTWALVVSGIWDKCQVIYPFLGGTTVNAQKWNLKDVRDLDAAFRLAFTGSGFTYSESGVSSSGTAGTFGNTFFTPSTNLASANSAHLSCFINSIPTLDNSIIIGSFSGAGSSTFQVGRISASVTFGNANSANASYMSGGTVTTGFWHVNRSGSAASSMYKNGIKITTSTASASAPNVQTYLFNRNGSLGASTGRLAFVSFGSSLTDEEARILAIIVQAYQTNLGR